MTLWKLTVTIASLAPGGILIFIFQVFIFVSYDMTYQDAIDVGDP